MSLSPDLAKLTPESWRAAKKAAGVKGAGFFDSSAGKAVATKIEKWQEATDAAKDKPGKVTTDALSKSLDELIKAFTAVKKDRSFTGEVQTEFRASIDKLVTALNVVHNRVLHDSMNDAKEETKAAPDSKDKQRKLYEELEKMGRDVKKVLAHKVIRGAYEAFLDYRHTPEMLEFLNAVARRTDADTIRSRFIGETATTPINISGKSTQAALAGNFGPAATEVIQNMNDELNLFHAYQKTRWT